MCGCGAVFYRVERYGEVSKLPEEAGRVVERLDVQRQPGGWIGTSDGWELETTWKQDERFWYTAIKI
jgi:hypothetical protein